MLLKTFSINNGASTIVLNDDAPKEEIAAAMLLDATEEHGNGRPIRKAKEKKDA